MYGEFMRPLNGLLEEEELEEGAGAADRTTAKLRGGYYTPEAVAAFLASWAIRDGSAHVLEPSAGDGAVVQAVASRLNPEGDIVAVELSPREAKRILGREYPNTKVVVGDAFAWYRRNLPDGRFDAVVGNPPFIRYHDFPEIHRQPALALMREEELRPNRLTNAWVPFVVLATRALRPGGRLALVIPAEILQVSYAAELRAYLIRKYSHITVVTFRRLVFEGIQQDTVLLLGVRRDGASDAAISFVELDGHAQLDVNSVDQAPVVPLELNHAQEKWTRYFLSPAELGLIRDLESAKEFGYLGDVARVDVGIVTGQNEFFVMSESTATRLGVRPWCTGLVGRSAQIPGLVLRQSEWKELLERDEKCLLLQIGDLGRENLPKEVRAYVEGGERLGFHTGYKCSLRLPRWWKVPADWVPGAFLLRQIHDAPRIVHNEAGVTCTDTIHRLRIQPGVNPQWLAAASLNSMTFAFAEIRGRSYGGGVLELEPSEAETLRFPTMGRCNAAVDYEELDRSLRNGGLDAVVTEVDRLTLAAHGLTSSETATLRSIWRKLSSRRHGRSRRRSSG